MIYKFNIIKTIEAYDLTIMEVVAKTGLSSAAIHRFETSNDCYFSDLFALAQAHWLSARRIIYNSGF